jgi:hypothetical protein
VAAGHFFVPKIVLKVPFCEKKMRKMTATGKIPLENDGSFLAAPPRGQMAPPTIRQG